jgi:nicotinamidase-related amidase
MEINNNQKTALLVMDVQGATVKMLENNAQFLKCVNNAIQKARQNQIPVIYVVVGFRKNFPEVSRNNKSFLQLKNGHMKLDTEEAFTVHESVSPLPDDIIVTKRRVSAFSGSDLEVVLRSFEINHLVLTGISTGGVVLSTAREASDKDFAVTVLSDCCFDRDEEVHRVLTTKIFPRQAEVMTSEEWYS